MTIQLDDAGWGSLVGPVILGACRVESPMTQHAFREVSVAYFQGEAYAQKHYLHVAADLAVELMRELRVMPEEEVHVCTGYVLEEVRARLICKGYQVIPGKIGEPLQTLIEQELLDRILALGVQTALETLTTKQGLYFWQCVNWLKAGDMSGKAIAQRAQHCKTGWATYEIWANYPYQRAKVLARQHRAEKRRERRPW
jgi:hypothetical protein